MNNEVNNIMNKSGLKTVLFLLIATIAFFPQVVKAVEEDANKCQEKIVDKIKITSTGKNRQMKTVKVTVPSIGEYIVEYTMTDYNDDVSDFGNDSNFTIVNQNEDGSYESISLPPGREIYVIVKLKSKYEFKNNKKEVTARCNEPGTISVAADGSLITSNIKKDENGNFVKYLGSYKTKKIQNPPANSDISSSETYQKTACQYMRNGIYNNDGSVSDNDIKTDYEGYRRYAASYFPYCFNENVSIPFTLSNKTINTVRKKIIKIYKSVSVINKGSIVVSPGFENITPTSTTNIGVLKCNKFPTKDANGKDSNNVNKYVYEETKDIKSDNVTVCTVKCREELEVIYGPPVATKAGLCFTYEVTVKSKVQCETNMSNKVELKKPNFCSPYPICDHGTHQAGPSDDFDSCVQQCDGGEYSQKCINKCYDEVYSNKKEVSNESDNDINNSIELLSYYNKEQSIIKKMADEEDPYDIKGCKTNSEIWNNLDTCAAKLTEAKHNEPCGHYEYTTDADIGTFEWKQSNSSCNIGAYHKNLYKEANYIQSIKRSSPYYTRNVAATKSLLVSLHGYQAPIGLKRYIIDDDGIKRQYSYRYQCGETCGYKGCSKNSAYNDKKAREQYEAYLKEYEEAVEKCNAAASCESKTSTFNISINAETDSDTAWQATNSTGKTDTDEKSGDTLIFTPQNGDADKDPFDGINGICYANRKMDWQHYKTTITFPGTWINLKSSKREYKKPSNEDLYKEKRNYFCVGYDHEPINEKWWEWKINKNGDLTKTAGVTVDNDKNITASIKDFGKFSWNIDINCFYALSNKVTTCVGENCNPSCNGAECDTTITNLKLRPVDQADLFAGRTGDKIGFNWTSAAKDLVASGTTYGIDPGEYATKLQTEAKNNSNATYSGTVDYSLHLTKDNIKKLREYVSDHKDEGGYTSYLGKLNNPSKEGVDGLYYYTSDILHNDVYITNFRRKDNILGINND